MPETPLEYDPDYMDCLFNRGDFFSNYSLLHKSGNDLWAKLSNYGFGIRIFYFSSTPLYSS